MNPRTFHISLIAIIAVVYFFSAKGYIEIADTGYSADTALSLYDRGSLAIASKGETYPGPDGKNYSRYGVGLPITFLPYVAVATGLSHVTKFPRMQLLGFLISFSNIPYAIATLFLFSRLLRKFDLPENLVCWMTVALGLGTLCWRYAGYDYSEEIQMALLVLIVQGLVRPKGSDVIWAGMAGAALIILKLIYILLFPVFGLYLLFQFRGRERMKALIQFGVPVLLAIAFTGWIDEVRFGNPFESGYGAEAHSWNFGQMTQTLPALILSTKSGMLIFCPILIMGIIGWRAFFQKHPPEALFCLGLVLVNLLWTAAWHGWDGGWAWGPRLLVPLVPFWLLPAAFAIQSSWFKPWFPAFVVLLGVSIIVQIPGILVKDQEIHHLRTNMLTPAEAAHMPGDWTAAWILLFHKWSHPDEVYHVSDLASPTDAPEKVIDLNSFQTFHGMNVWTEQSSRQMGKPMLRWLPLAGLLVIIGILATLLARRRRIS